MLHKYILIYDHVPEYFGLITYTILHNIAVVTQHMSLIRSVLHSYLEAFILIYKHWNLFHPCDFCSVFFEYQK